MDSPADVWLVRHGQTDWSLSGRHTGRTDVELTPEGEAEAAALEAWADKVAPDVVLCSPRSRARRTAEIAGLVPYEVVEDLHEWDYGELEGLTSVEIRASRPGWEIWSGPWAGGETAADVASRADRVVDRVRSTDAGRVVLVGHGHFSRVLGARWAGAEVSAGRWLALDTASWSQLGWDRSVPVIRRWNVPAGDPRA